MTQDAIAAAVEQHTCAVFGTRYSLKLVWAAVEESGSTSLSYLLRIQLSALEETTKAPVQMRLLVSIAELSDLPALVDQALHQQLFENVMTATPERPWALAMQRGTAVFQRPAKALRMVWRQSA
jgi:hypothetical protein